MKNTISTEMMFKAAGKLYKTYLEKTKLESTRRMILVIIKKEGKLGREQRYQATSRITDILNSTNSEQEIVNKLKKEYPQYS